MNKQRFTEITENPINLKDDLNDLHELQALYPYCQPIHVLVALANHEAKTDHAAQTLSYAAMHVVDRGNLKNILNGSGTFKSNTPGKKTISLKEPEYKPLKKETDLKPSEQNTLKVVEKEDPKTSQQNKNLPAETNEVLPTEIPETLHPKTISGLPEKSKATFTSLPENEGDQFREGFIKNLENLRLSKKRWEDEQSPEEKAVNKPAKPKKEVKKKKLKSGEKKKISEKSVKKEKKKKETKATKAKPEKIKKNKVKEQQDLIEKFIEISPSIKAKAANPPAVDPNQKDLSISSTSFGDHLISENLAEIFISQGKIDKAIDIYKKLIWKYPQKKAYFATRIEELNK